MNLNTDSTGCRCVPVHIVITSFGLSGGTDKWHILSDIIMYLILGDGHSVENQILMPNTELRTIHRIISQHHISIFSVRDMNLPENISVCSVELFCKKVPEKHPRVLSGTTSLHC